MSLKTLEEQLPTDRFIRVHRSYIVQPAKIRAIERNRSFCGIPWGFHLIRFAQGVLPTCLFDRIIGQWAGIYHTMDHFTGRR